MPIPTIRSAPKPVADWTPGQLQREAVASKAEQVKQAAEASLYARPGTMSPPHCLSPLGDMATPPPAIVASAFAAVPAGAAAAAGAAGAGGQDNSPAIAAADAAPEPLPEPSSSPTQAAKAAVATELEMQRIFGGSGSWSGSPDDSGAVPEVQMAVQELVAAAVSAAEPSEPSAAAEPAAAAMDTEPAATSSSAECEEPAHVAAARVLGHSTGRRPPAPESVRQPILYRDAHFCVVDKPADVRIDGEHQVTATKLLSAQVGKELAPELRMCHQLDYATSGVMLFAFSKCAAGAAQMLFEQRTTKKRYLALVRGKVSQLFDVERAIAKDPNHDFKMMLAEEESVGAKTAKTRAVPVAHGLYRGEVVTKVLLLPHSGRRHQLRLHCLAAGHPIVGDGTYGVHADDEQAPRMMLHAWDLYLPFPEKPHKGVSFKPLRFASDDPFVGLLEGEKAVGKTSLDCLF